MSRRHTVAHPIYLTLALSVTFGLPVLLLYVFGSAGGGFDHGRVTAWGACMVGLLALYGCIGVEIKGRAGGVLIDERNRFSLSRLQMLAWTTLLAASLFTLFVGNAMRSDPPLEIMKIAVDWNLVAASGFSLVCLVGAPLALSRKADAPSPAGDLERANAKLEPQQNLSQPVAAVGRVVVKGSTEDARLADLFRGEEVQNATLIDLARLQMLVVSAVVILGYCITMVVHLGVPAEHLHALPAFSPTVLSLVLISHTGYLAGKITPTSPASASTAAEQTSRVLAVAKGAIDLSARADGLMAQTLPASPLLGRLQQILADARLVAADANAWTSNAPQSRVSDPQILEQRFAAVQSAFLIAAAQRDAAIEAPDAAVVRTVQDKLVQGGYAPSQNGDDDLQTRGAINAWMNTTRTDPTSLATSRKRFYEELVQLI